MEPHSREAAAGGPVAVRRVHAKKSRPSHTCEKWLKLAQQDVAGERHVPCMLTYGPLEAMTCVRRLKLPWRAAQRPSKGSNTDLRQGLFAPQQRGVLVQSTRCPSSVPGSGTDGQ
ncbi:hypothetical protein CSAL01_09374 [Colletotrichum salicis]|uniref:Uncharacterized protein n=1 Tax=Colletotrichum salicis TaxID=1209931 RepID=A0A135SLJ7_9PEZI|nr:hypothetical protein CSAL01_09374 [Colletotrichum salicis]